MLVENFILLRLFDFGLESRFGLVEWERGEQGRVHVLIKARLMATRPGETPYSLSAESWDFRRFWIFGASPFGVLDQCVHICIFLTM